MVDTSFIFNRPTRQYNIFIEINSYIFYVSSINKPLATRAATDIRVQQPKGEGCNLSFVSSLKPSLAAALFHEVSISPPCTESLFRCVCVL